MGFEITSGKVKKPFNVILAGVEGIGKSSWAAGYEDPDGLWHEGAPSPIFIGSEENDELEADRYPIATSFDEANMQLTHLISNPKHYKTVVLDTINAMETMLHKKLLASDPKQTGSMMAAYGGYGKAYDMAESQLMLTRSLLKTLRDKCNMNVIILAHTKKAKQADTTIGMEYDTYEMAMHPKAQALFVSWVSGVFFANFIARAKEGVNSDKMFAMGHGKRIMYTAKRPGHLGKNRYNLPFEMDLEFSEFYAAYEAFYAGKPRDPAQLVEEIKGLLTNIKDAGLAEKIMASVEAVKTDPDALLKYLGRVNELIGETGEATT